MRERGAETSAADPRTEYRDARLHDLVKNAQRGDQDAFRALYRSLAPRLLNYLRAQVGERDAEDVASETWAAIARDLSKYRESAGDFRGWAAAIARHRAVDHVRRNRGLIPIPDDRLPDRQAPDNTEAAAQEAIATSAALSMIAELPHDQAQAVLLRVIVGLDAPAAGRILNKRPGAVRTAAHRGLRTLADRLTRRRDPSGAPDARDVTACEHQTGREVIRARARPAER
jgi:RNA polymerase sigma-70 factor (ECF subfamily)